MRGLHAGTPSYMNPEQWGTDAAEPTQADAASDVFALGVTLYEWLTTKLPYGNIEPYQSGRFRRDPKPPSRLRPDVPIWLGGPLGDSAVRMIAASADGWNALPASLTEYAAQATRIDSLLLDTSRATVAMGQASA